MHTQTFETAQEDAATTATRLPSRLALLRLCDEAHTSELPVVRVCLGLEHQPEDEVAVVALGVLVHSRVVGPMGSVDDAHAFQVACGGRGHVDGRHAQEELLRLGLVQSPFLSVPASAFDEEPVDVLAFLWHISDALKVVRQDLGVRDDVVQRPLVPLVLPRDLLPHAREEALGVREASEPVGFHHLPVILQPGVQHGLSVQEAREPAA
mmetsp:Transcript_37171/g.86533  ORF Transcript_37171/g.86533 Transcript_37171/m.86533 type:complete len:209 (-) Transcript_37171:1676-2302(-)